MTDTQLRRLRWAVRATLTLGVAASVAANVLHARPNPISQIIAAWPPLALMLTVELISRVPHHRWFLGAIRITAAAIIAIIAGWVSYWHLVGVAARYGETGYGAAYLLPISVDGLVIVASVSLVEITARIRSATPATDSPSADPIPTPDPHHDDRKNPCAPGSLATKATAPETTATPERTTRARTHGTDDVARVTTPARKADAVQPPAADKQGPDRNEPPDAAAADDVPTETAGAVAHWRRRDPTLHPADIAARIGKSERTVRRHWLPRTKNGTPHANGHLAGSPPR
ncbi:DUF2637 domain-containing protein [Micromonospora sp. NPDC048909]|uniref:DUF2637 domain-containing protein n=1 Tax=Micromonospora sp. NPDC048909 TaxID=3155643 RepID=UPI0033C2825F